MAITDVPNTYLLDFGQDVTVGGSTVKGILDMPDEIVAGDMVVITDYLLTVKTSDFSSVSLGAPPAAISNTLVPSLLIPPFSLPSKVEAVLDIPLFSSITIFDNP